MEMNSIEKIKKLTVDNILKDNDIKELYLDIMGDIINTASNGKTEISIPISEYNYSIKIEQLFKLLGYEVYRASVDWFCANPKFVVTICWK